MAGIAIEASRCSGFEARSETIVWIKWIGAHKDCGKLVERVDFGRRGPFRKMVRMMYLRRTAGTMTASANGCRRGAMVSC